MLMITVIWNQVKAFSVGSNNQDSFMNTWKRNQRAGRHFKVLNFFFFGCILKKRVHSLCFSFSSQSAERESSKVKLAAVSINNT